MHNECNDLKYASCKTYDQSFVFLGRIQGPATWKRHKCKVNLQQPTLEVIVRQPDIPLKKTFEATTKDVKTMITMASCHFVCRDICSLEAVGSDGFKHFVDKVRGFVSLKWGWVGYLLYFKGFPLISLYREPLFIVLC